MSAHATYGRLRVRSAEPLPVADMVLGQSPDAAADLLPRLFNLCRVAQSVAARAAFGLPQDPDWRSNLRAEIIREHVVKLCLKWPAALSIDALPLPQGWQSGTAEAREALFGPSGQVPRSGDAVQSVLTSGTGIAVVLRAISDWFAPGEGVRAALPLTTPDTALTITPQENSPAARHANHSAMQHVARIWGHGPLWSALGVACDLEALWAGTLPMGDLQPGRAVVPAARGYYGVAARVQSDRIVAFTRVTPTDHLLARGGSLSQSLTRLPEHQADLLAPALLSILDPCHPVSVERGEEARAYA